MGDRTGRGTTHNGRRSRRCPVRHGTTPRAEQTVCQPWSAAGWLCSMEITEIDAQDANARHAWFRVEQDTVRHDRPFGWERTFESRSEEQTSELQPLMRRSYAVFCLNNKHTYTHTYVCFL